MKANINVLGEYIDLDTYMGKWESIQIAMNVLYRPIKQKLGKKYLIEDYNPDKKRPPTRYANGCCV
jgi:hypothetical protein